MANRLKNANKRQFVTFIFFQASKSNVCAYFLPSPGTRMFMSRAISLMMKVVLATRRNKKSFRDSKHRLYLFTSGDPFACAPLSEHQIKLPFMLLLRKRFSLSHSRKKRHKEKR
jgi:hypothetical protein